MRCRVRGLHTSNAPFDKPPLDNVLLSQVVVLLKEYPVSHALEQILSEHRLWLRLLPHVVLGVARLTLVLATRAHLRQEVLLGELHIVNQNHAKLVFLGQIKQAHQSLGENSLSLAIPKLRKPEMLIESVENDKPDARKLL